MPRFVLIDHSLVDYSGHHFEYAQAVLNAAAEAGYEPILAANRRFKSNVREAWPVFPSYKYGIWLHQGPRWQQRLHASLASARRISRHIGRRTDDATGNRSAAERRRGGFVRNCIQAERSRQFVRDSSRLVQKLRLGAGDIALFSTVSLEEFAALRRAWPFAGPSSAARWHFLFRRDFALETGGATDRLREAFEPCAELDGRQNWHFWTDSEQLTALYSEATGQPFDTLPIPHTQLPMAASPAAGPFRILFLGDARREKGFHHLPRIVKALTGNGCRRFEFLIQAHTAIPGGEPGIAESRAELARLSRLGVKLFDKPLESYDYRSLLASGQLSLLPYDSSAYAARSSGILSESLAAGIPAIVPAHTWMSQQLPPGAGLAYQGLDEIPSRVQELASNYERFDEQARQFANAWRRQHNAGRLLSLLELGRQRSHDASSEPAPDRHTAGLGVLRSS